MTGADSGFIAFGMVATQSPAALTAEETAAVKSLESRHRARAAAMLGISRESMARIIAGLGVRRGTVSSVRLALSRMPADAAPDALLSVPSAAAVGG